MVRKVLIFIPFFVLFRDSFVKFFFSLFVKNWLPVSEKIFIVLKINLKYFSEVLVLIICEIYSLSFIFFCVLF